VEPGTHTHMHGVCVVTPGPGAWPAGAGVSAGAGIRLCRSLDETTCPRRSRGSTWTR
jgi:hypothetical protein